MKKILQVLPNLDLGGIERFVMNCYNSFDHNDIQFDFLVLNEEKSIYSDSITSGGGKVFYHKFPSIKNIFEFYDFFKTIVDEHGPYDVVHSHIGINSYYISIMSFLCGITIRISHSHMVLGRNSNYTLMDTIKVILIKQFSNYCLACSKTAGEYLFGKSYFGKRGIVIYNGINTSEFVSVDSHQIEEIKKEWVVPSKDTLVIGNISRFDQYKNNTFCIKVFKFINRLIPNSILVMGGSDWGALSECKTLANKLELREKIRFVGARTDMAQCLNCIDIFLFPSKSEGFGMVAIEAQASGCFCVASSNVTKEVDCKIGSMLFLDLNKNEEEWATEIINEYKIWRKPGKAEILKAFSDLGFDSKDSYRHLEEIYKK